jgi:hypothetical protein
MFTRTISFIALGLEGVGCGGWEKRDETSDFYPRTRPTQRHQHHLKNNDHNKKHSIPIAAGCHCLNPHSRRIVRSNGVPSIIQTFQLVVRRFLSNGRLKIVDFRTLMLFESWLFYNYVM